MFDILIRSNKETTQIYHIHKQFMYKIESKYQILFIFYIIMLKECFCHVLDLNMIWFYLCVRRYHSEDQTGTWVWISNLANYSLTTPSVGCQKYVTKIDDRYCNQERSLGNWIHHIQHRQFIRMMINVDASKFAFKARKVI